MTVATRYKAGAFRTIRGATSGETSPLRIRLSDGDITHGWRIVGFDVSSRTATNTDDEVVGKICTEERAGTTAAGWAWDSNVEIAWAANQVNAGNVSQETGSYWDEDTVVVDDIFLYLLDTSQTAELCNYMIRMERMKLNLNQGLTAVVANKAQSV